jgi:hypothetical protein
MSPGRTETSLLHLHLEKQGGEQNDESLRLMTSGQGPFFDSSLEHRGPRDYQLLN